MRVALRILVAAALATVGLTAVAPTPASANAPAPYCESGMSRFLCDASSTGPTTWTVTWYSGSVGTFTSAGATLIAACPASNLNLPVRVSYSYFDGSVTQYSDTGRFSCRSGPWQ